MTQPSDLDRFLAELKRRRVYRVAVGYAVAAFATLQALDIALPALTAPDWILRACVILVLLGFPIAIVLSWIFDLTSRGVARTEALSDGVAVPELSAAQRSLRLVGAVGLLAVLLGSSWWVLRPTIVGGMIVAGADVIAVLPFRTTGPGTGSLGEGMVDLLSTNLDQVGAIRTIPPRRVLRSWERSSEADFDRGTPLEIGRSLGAGSVVEGSVTEVGGQVRLSAELRTVGGTGLARATVEGPSEQVLALVDSLSFALLRGVWRSREPVPSFDVGAITTTSLPAVRAYLRGEMAYRRSQWDSAIEAFGEAVGADSTFALAHHRLSITYGWRELLGSTNARRHGESAIRHVDRLPSRPRALVRATALWYGDELEAAMDTLRSYVARYPDDADGWFLLGDVDYHRPERILMDPEPFYLAFERVLEIDSTLTPALYHPIDLSLSSADSVRYRAYLGQLEAATGPTDMTGLLYGIGSLLWPDPGTVVTADALLAQVQEIARIRPGLFTALGTAHVVGARGSPNEMADAFSAFAAQLPDGDPTKASFSFYLAPRLTALGRFAEARPHIARLQTASPAAAATFRIGPVMAGLAGSDFLDGTIEDAASVDVWGSDLAPFIEATLRLATGDVGGARGFDDGPAAPGLAEAQRDLVRGWGDLIGGDTAGGLPALDRGVRSAYDAVGRTQAVILYEPYRFRLLDARARRPDATDEAVRALRNQRWVDPHYIVLTHLSLGEALEAIGDDSGARPHYERFLELLKRADPSVEPLIARARAGLARIGD